MTHLTNTNTQNSLQGVLLESCQGRWVALRESNNNPPSCYYFPQFSRVRDEPSTHLQHAPHVLEDINVVETPEQLMAIPLRPCTWCDNLRWIEREYEKGDMVKRYRSRICEVYANSGAKPQPWKPCRCVHFTPGR